MTLRLLCDLGWLSVFLPDDWEKDRYTFCRDLQNASLGVKLTIALKYIQIHKQIQQQLLFLEQLVVADTMAVDQIAISSSLAVFPKELESCFQLLAPEPETYLKALEAAQSLKKGFPTSSEGEACGSELSNRLSEDPFWAASEKEYHDALFRRGVYTALADSHDSLGRALFYLEFSRRLGVTPTLSSGKQFWLEEFKQRLVPPLHRKIADMFDKAVSEQLLTVLDDVTAVRALETPPVAELIVRTSLRENLPLDTVTMELRDSKEARSYRSLLADIEGLLATGREGLLEAARAISGLSKVASQWSKSLDPGLGVSRKSRRISLKTLPAIGWLLEAADMSEMQLKDYVLTSPPGYLAFISSWYAK